MDQGAKGEGHHQANGYDDQVALHQEVLETPQHAGLLLTAVPASALPAERSDETVLVCDRSPEI
jgi:hypothetical protein